MTLQLISCEEEGRGNTSLQEKFNVQEKVYILGVDSRGGEQRKK